jgi:hypothetical protein
MPKRNSKRCEIVSQYTRSLPWHKWSVQGRRCRCIIGEDRGALSSLYDGTVIVCENHQKVLMRGKAVVDYYGRVWRIDKETGELQKTGTTSAAFEDDEG